jgi:uncharacterized membrane protein
MINNKVNVIALVLKNHKRNNSNANYCYFFYDSLKLILLILFAKVSRRMPELSFKFLSAISFFRIGIFRRICVHLIG